MPTPPGEAGGGMANAIVGTLILCGLGATVRDPDRRPQRHLHRRIGRHAAGQGGALRRRHAQRCPLDRDRPLRVRAGRRAAQALHGAGRRVRARRHDDSARRRARPRNCCAWCPRRSAKARWRSAPRAARAVFTRRAAGRAARHHHRRRPRARAHRRRNGAAALHVVQQPLLVDEPHRSRCRR